jgi:hypothetical protein
MTVKAIAERLEIETTIHETARQCVELIAAAKAKVKSLGGDADDAAERILSLVGDD